MVSKEDAILIKSENNTNIYMVCGTQFEIDTRYEILDPMGQGAYGIVVAAKDLEGEEEEEENNLVAIKKIERAFEHKVFMQRTLRELKIQRLLQHENILGIRTILKPRSREDFSNIYIVSDLMETDLGAIIKST